MNLVAGIFLGLAFAFLASAAVAQEAALCGGNPIPARVIEVLDANTLKLDDDRVVRFTNVILPLPIDGDSEAAMRAKKSLSEIVNGKGAAVFMSSETKDRYGRMSAHGVVIDGIGWLEAALLSRGIARVFPGPNDKCTKTLLQFEDKARALRVGLWQEPRFQILDAGAIEALLAAEGRFVVVEGVVRRVGEARGRIFLDFGRRFTEDFTIIVPDQLRKSLTALGSDPKSWRGRGVRVRGVLFSWGGPAIELNLASAIELLDREIPKTE
jgi:micrococcal nuclease